MDGAGVLIVLADYLANGTLPPEQVRQRVIKATRSWLNGSPLEAAFGIKPSANGYTARDEALRRAAILVGSDPYKLAKEIRRFETRVWPRWRDRSEPPSSASPLDQALFTAYQAGRSVPCSRRHLARILDKNHCFSVQDQGAK